MQRKWYVEVVSFALTAYIVYASVSGDTDLSRLQKKLAVDYRYKTARRWWRQFGEPAWRSELREYNVEDYTLAFGVGMDQPIPAGEDV